MLTIHAFVRRAIGEFIELVDGLPFDIDGHICVDTSRSSCTSLSSSGLGDIVFNGHG